MSVFPTFLAQEAFLALAPGNALDETKWFMEDDQRWEKYEVPPGHPMGEGRIYFWSLDSVLSTGGSQKQQKDTTPLFNFMRNVCLSLSLSLPPSLSRSL